MGRRRRTRIAAIAANVSSPTRAPVAMRNHVLEGITRSGQGDRFYAMTGGFESTLGNVGNSGLDIGLLAEYSHDTRSSDFTQPPFAVALFDKVVADGVFDLTPRAPHQDAVALQGLDEFEDPADVLDGRAAHILV